MWRRLKKVAIAFVAVVAVAFAAAQLVRPERTNPATDSTRTIHAHAGPALVAVLDRACGDCHSNATVWTRYTQVAPLSWVIVRGVTEARKVLNFSEGGAYSPSDQRDLLHASCRDATDGSMPMRPYLALRPEARLSAQDVQTICEASRQADANAATNGRPPSLSTR